MKVPMKRLNKLVIACAAIMSPLCAGAATDTETTITFVELNDLHANLVPHKELIRHPDGSTSVAMRGGMARMKTLIDNIENENRNTIVMNIGDTFHGGVEAFYSLGNAVADPLNALGIDVGVPGNWDYYFTPAVTRVRYGRVENEVLEVTFPNLDDPFPIKRPNFPNLGANVRDITDAMPEDFLPPTHMIEKDGVKIGFIGFTSDIVELMHPMLAEGMDFAWGRDEHTQLLLKYSQQLRDQGADIVAVMSELGIHKDIALSETLAEMEAAGKIPSGLIDVFFSAHTHETTFDPITQNDAGVDLYAPVVEAGDDAYLGRMDVRMKYEGTINTGTRRRPVSEQVWSNQGMEWKMLPVDASVPEDEGVKELVKVARAPFLKDDVNLMAVPFVMQHLTQPIDTVIGHLPPGSVMNENDALSGVLTRKGSLTSSFNTALTQMMRDITGTDVALSPGFRMGATVPEAGFMMENDVMATGDITLEDAYRFFPMYYGLAIGETTGKHMRDVIEGTLGTTYSSDTWNTQGGWNYGYDGVDMELDLAAGDDRRVVDLRLSDTGKEIKDNDVITVAGCRRLPIDFQGTLCGIGGFDNVVTVQNPNTRLPWSLVDVFTHMLQDEGYALSAVNTSVHDDNQTPLWPASPYIQPLEGVGEYYIPQDQKDPCGFFKWNCINR